MPDAKNPAALAALGLLVNNHPGVGSHVCGLFARRCFNMEAFFAAPAGFAPDGRPLCRIWILAVLEGESREERELQLTRIVRQVRKLEDVREVTVLPAGHDTLQNLTRTMLDWESSL